MSVIVLPKAQIEYGEIYGMAQRQQEIEAFVQHLVVEVEAAGAVGMIAPQAITDHFNAKGVTPARAGARTARLWPILSSRGAKRCRSGGKSRLPGRGHLWRTGWCFKHCTQGPMGQGVPAFSNATPKRSRT